MSGRKIVRLAAGSLIGATALLAAAGFPPACASDAVVTGLWLVEAKDAVVDIQPCGDRLCGKVVWLKEPQRSDGSPRRDDKNPKAELRSRALCGLELMNGFKPAAKNEWDDGHIYAADEGETYAAEMALLDQGRLKVRGFVGISLFGKSQIWTRAAAETPRARLSKGGCATACRHGLRNTSSRATTALSKACRSFEVLA